MRTDGKIVHPYIGARRCWGGDQHSAWIIKTYLPFTQEWAETDESEFRALPLSTPEAVRAQARRHTKS
ncbi:hypothetical protein WJ33_23470 [Burkholderia ubonensis]|uniref:Uncharacterized protein n=1 Tax=Burkholderia ubonensis TaxID=101571 RepID=A0A103RJ81_9BURK|nr:hypothetical protein WJ33_23470 [Burkholderia ubonensis]